MAGVYEAAARDSQVIWFLAAGALIFFNFFPRMDTMHVTFSASLVRSRLFRALPNFLR